MKTIFHIDVNNAFLSWEAVDRLNNGETLDLRTVPSAVCGDSNSRHGIILAKSTPAKKFGIITGEPTVSALKKCPQLICVPPRHKMYENYSKCFFKTLERFSDRVEKYSVDEGFLDYTGMEQIYGEAIDTAYIIKNTIFEELGFTVNIGISTNKILAKMAGELEKPNKVITLWPDEIKNKLWSQPVENLFMVGRKTTPKLKKMGIHTIGQLAEYDINYLYKEFKNYAYILHNYANGIDNSPVLSSSYHEDVKSIGNSITLPEDAKDKETAYRILLWLSETVSARLRSQELFCNEVAVTIKTSSFFSYSHQRKTSRPIDCTNSLYNISKEIFNSMWHGEPIRLLGIRTADLSNNRIFQLSLDNKDSEKERLAEKAMDKIKERFGNKAVMRSTFLNNEIKHK